MDGKITAPLALLQANNLLEDLNKNRRDNIIIITVVENMKQVIKDLISNKNYELHSSK